MIHSKRKPTNKFADARKFRKDTAKTHPRNVKIQPRRGGWRL